MRSKRLVCCYRHRACAAVERGIYFQRELVNDVLQVDHKGPSVSEALQHATRKAISQWEQQEVSATSQIGGTGHIHAEGARVFTDDGFAYVFDTLSSCRTMFVMQLRLFILSLFFWRCRLWPRFRW
jgi:hypothetical protein